MDKRDWQWEEFHNHHLFDDRDEGDRYPDIADDPDQYLKDLLEEVKQVKKSE